MLKPVIVVAVAALSLHALADDRSVDRLRASATEYKERYKLHDLNHSAVDDLGRGPGDLQGLRNFRSVLPGVLYRAGGNNAYRTPKLPNQGPLPPEALSNLCRQGFTRAVYLYRPGYTPQTVTCQYKGQPHQMTYSQVLTGNGKAKETQVLQLVRDQIEASSPEPVLVHCFNGYHESGYVSAIALRQFCGFSGDQAYKYWVRNAAPGVNFEAMRIRITRFEPKPELAISPMQRASICVEGAETP